MRIVYYYEHTGNFTDIAGFKSLVDPAAIIDSIDGQAFIAWCESCSNPILDGDVYACDPDGIYVCRACMDESPAD